MKFYYTNKKNIAWLFLAAFLLIAGRIHAQNEAGRTFTLTETMQILFSADSNGAGEFRWDPFFRGGSFSIGGHFGAFSTAPSEGHTGYFILNNRDIHAVPLPYTANGELVFPERFVRTAREAFDYNITGPGSQRYRIAAIVIDPGHGGRDPGAIGRHVIDGQMREIAEKDIVLNASKMLRDMLVRTYPDKRILMTRESDRFITLDERADIANAVPIRDNEAIIFVSVHTNASTNRNARGFEVWILSQSYRRTLLDESDHSDSPVLRRILNSLLEQSINMESTKLGMSILDAMEAAAGNTMPNRGLKEEAWFVVRNSRMPAVLVELGFITNREDALIMTTDRYLRNLVEALYKGIKRFVENFESSGGFVAAL